MAKILFTPQELTKPRWMADWGDRMTLMPMGARVRPNSIPLSTKTNLRTLESGQYIGRVKGRMSFFEPITVNTTTRLLAVVGALAPAGSSVLSLDTVDGFLPGDILTVMVNGVATDVTIAANGVNATDRTITLTANLGAGGVAANTNVMLKNFLNMNEFYVSVYDLIDAVQNPEVTLLRHNSLIKENFLPQWVSATKLIGNADIDTSIRSYYKFLAGAN